MHIILSIGGTYHLLLYKCILYNIYLNTGISLYNIYFISSCIRLQYIRVLTMGSVRLGLDLSTTRTVCTSRTKLTIG